MRADQIAELAEGYRSSKTMTELASEFGIHRTTVSSHLAEHRVPVRREGLRRGQAAEAVRLHEKTGRPGG